MNAASAPAWEWMLAEPQDTLTPDALPGLPQSSLILTSISALFSYALAETYLARAVHGGAPLAFLFGNFLLQGMGFFCVLFVIQQIVRYVRPQPVPFRLIFALGTVALVPVHLALPLALLCRPLGSVGLILFSLGELALWLAVLRRWTSGFKSLFALPIWASTLVVLSPFLLGCFFLLLFTAFAVLCAAVLVIGVLA